MDSMSPTYVYHASLGNFGYLCTNQPTIHGGWQVNTPRTLQLLIRNGIQQNIHYWSRCSIDMVAHTPKKVKFGILDTQNCPISVWCAYDTWSHWRWGITLMSWRLDHYCWNTCWCWAMWWSKIQGLCWSLFVHGQAIHAYWRFERETRQNFRCGVVQ